MKRATVLTAILLALAVAPMVGLAEETSVCIPYSVAAASAANLVDAHVGGLLYTMELLASTADLQVGVWTGMRNLLGRFEQLPISFNAWFLLPDGSYYKVESGLTGKNLSDRAYFPKVMAGETTLGDLVVSKSTGRKSMVLTVPIVRSGAVVGALGATVYLDDLSQLIADALDLPAEVGFYARTADERIALHTDPDLLLEGASTAGVSAVAEAFSETLGWAVVVGSTGD